MSKKSFVVILILSAVVTYLTQIAQVFMGGSCSVFSGKCGFPLTFSSSSFLDTPKTNYTFFLIDTVFWFVVLYLIWQLYKKFLKR